MRPWAQWTAKTALLAAGFAAAVGGLSGVALAAGGSASSDAGPGLSLGRLIAPASVCDNAGALLGVVGAACQVGTAVLPPAAPAQTGPGTANTAPAGSGRSPASPCGSAAAVLGDSTAGCASGALAGVTQPRPAAGTASGGTASGGSAAGVIQRAVAPVTSVLGVTAPAGTGSFASGPLAGLQQMSGLAPLATAPAPRGLAGERVRRTFGNPPGASGAGDTNVPAASQLAGLGALPGLADLPSLAGLANMPARNGVTGGGIPMPGTAMSAAKTSGMSSDSFAALAVGALLAGASALKIAGRRARPQGGIWSSYMKKVRWVSATAGAALVAAMFALPGAGVAYASDNGNTTGNGNVSVLSGNSITAPISVPVNLCGISLAVAGFSNAGCEGGSSSTISGVDGNSHNGNTTGNRNISLGSGNTITAPISAPVNVCGVSGTVGGFSNSGCKGGSSSTISGVGGHSDNGNTTGNFNIPIASGNTVTTPVSAPINLCGISLALLGLSNAGCVGGADSTISGVGGHSHNGNVTGNFNIPVGSGNTITAPISVPVNVCGNAVAAAGFANANCKGGSTSCIGSNCNMPCTRNCTPPCRHNCHTPRPCRHNCHTPPPCRHNCHTPPPCMHNCHTPPPGCTTNCGGTPPGCTANCGGTPPGGTPPGGTGPGTTTVSTGTSPAGLPTTGADLLLLGVAALATIGVGAGAVAVARRRRNSEV